MYTRRQTLICLAIGVSPATNATPVLLGPHLEAVLALFQAPKLQVFLPLKLDPRLMALSEVYAVQKAESLPTPKELIPSAGKLLLERLSQLEQYERPNEVLPDSAAGDAVSMADQYVLQRLQDHPGGTNSKYFWIEFGRIYPGFSGLARLSRLAADDKRSEYTYYFEYECGAHCGMGGVAHVRKQGEKLVLVQYGIQWVT